MPWRRLALAAAFVSSAGAFGGVLSARVATGLHLGTRRAALWPDGRTRADVIALGGLALPVMLYNAAGAWAVSGLLGPTAPGLADMVATTLFAGFGAVTFAFAIAYLSGVAAVQVRLDPDTYGIPIVTSSVDLVGAVLLTSTAVLLGVAG